MNKPTPQSVSLGTEAYAEALERKRQAVLAHHWRPKKCAVPWTPGEEDSYREASLHNTAIASSWQELADRHEVDEAIAKALTPPPKRLARILAMPRRTP